MKSKRAKKLVIFTLVLTAVCFIVVLYLEYVQGEMERETARTLQEVAAQSATLVHERLNSDFFILEQIAGNLAANGYALPGKWSLNDVRAASSQNPHFTRITLVSREGDVYDWDGRVIRNIAERGHFQSALAGNNVAVNVAGTQEGDSAPSVILEVPVKRSGRVACVLLGQYDGGMAASLVEARIFGGAGYQYMATSQGDIFLTAQHPDSDPDFHNIVRDFHDAAFLGAQTFEDMVDNMGRGRQGYLLYRWNGTERVMSYMPVGVSGWYLLTIVPREVVVSRTARLFGQALFLAALFLLLFLGVAFYTIRLGMRDRRKLVTLYNAVPGAIFRCRCDRRWTVLNANDSFYRFLGCTPEEFAGKGGCMASVIYPEDMEEISQALETQLARGGAMENQNRMVCAGGEIRWVWIKCKRTENEDGEAELYCVFMDITELKRMERQSAMNRQRYEIVMDRMQDTVLEWSVGDGTVDYSKSFAKKFGFDPGTKDFPQSLLETGRVPAEDAEEVLSAVSRAQAGESAQGEFRIRGAKGDGLWCRMLLTPLRDTSGCVERVIGVISDIDAQKRRMRRMEWQARMDPLTRLYNRGAAEELIRAYLEERGGHGALIILDVDDFKQVNDCNGHQKGDEVLRRFGAALLSQFRSGDVVGRIGGDEFIALMKDLPEGYTVAEKAKAILSALHEAYSAQEAVSCSMGVALFQGDGGGYDELFRKADVALYYAKRHGKGCFAVYSKSMENEENAKINSEIF